MDERYQSFAGWCRRTYGRHLYRIPLDAHMTCPNRDGTLGYEGCAFCAAGSGDFAIPYEGQKLERKDLIYSNKDGKEGDYIAYFQSYSNTYAPIERLRKLYMHALEDPLFAGISIATRPDCFDEETYGLLEEMKKQYPDKFIWIELGLQTANEKSAERMHRGYANAVFENCVRKLHALGLPVIVHIIIGLPDEDIDDDLKTVQYLNALKIEGIKIHLLHFLKGTEYGRLYAEGKIKELSMSEYVSAVAECLAELDPDTVIHRLSGDGSGELLLGPDWSRDKKKVLNAIRHEMKVKGYTQGCHYEPERTDQIS